jgi:hypothetical protein
MSIALSLGNNLTTGGIFKPTAVNNTSVNNVTDFAGIASDATLVLLSTQTASASANISFTSGIDSTYDKYIFKFINCHPATDDVDFQFNMSTDSGSTYDVTKTTTIFRARHDESDASAELVYSPSQDLAQSTAFQTIGLGIGNGNDESCSGSLTLFNPSSTTFVKHFIATSNSYTQGTSSRNSYVSGYGNTTSAVNAVQFKFDSGNIDDGIIKMYGLVKS